MYKMFQKGFQFVRRTRSGEKCAAGAKKIETRAKITVSDVKNMENIAKFTKKCIKNRAEGAIFFGFGQISKKPPPSFWDLSNKGGAFYWIWFTFFLFSGRRPENFGGFCLFVL